MQEETLSDIVDELKELASFFRDTFRHNQTREALQKVREERVERLEECIRKIEELE